MATITCQATANANPDGTQPGSVAVSGASNTGHTTTLAAGFNGTSQSKSCRWHTFSPTSISGTITSMKLKLDWSRDGDLAGGGNQFRIQYTINGGSNWITALDHTGVDSSSSGSLSITLSNSQDISQIQVRDLLSVNSVLEESTTLTAAISAIQVEVITGSGLAVLAGGC